MIEADFRQLTDSIRRLTSRARQTLVAIDGRCGAGKTTLAARLQAELGGQVLHMDDFFLRPEQRTESRLAQPGGNVDYERFLEEVLLPLTRGQDFIYRPYSCARQQLGTGAAMQAMGLTIVEGSYACHPALREHYDLRLFLTVTPEEQLRRIRARSGPEKADVFVQRWIPLEELYFRACAVAESADLVLEE